MKDLELKVHPKLFSAVRDELLKNGIVVTSEENKNILIIASEDPRQFFQTGVIYHKILNNYGIIRNTG